MAIAAPSEAPAGTVVYATASGYASTDTVEAEATIGDDSLGVVLTQEPAGDFRACVSVPSGAVGTVSIEFGNGRHYAKASVMVA